MSNPSQSLLESIESLMDAGRYLTALRESESLGPLDQWPGPNGQVQAGRLATHVGNPSLGRILHARAWKRWPDHVELIYYRWIQKLDSRRLVRNWLELRDLELPSTATTVEQSYWLTLKSTTLATIRDFDRAHRFIEEADRMNPNDPWIWVNRAYILERQDSLEASSDVLQETLKLRPHYRHAVQSLARQLHARRQDEEALQLLQSASQHLESGSVVWQIAMMLEERDQHQQAWEILDTIESYYPLLRKKHSDYFYKTLACHRSDIAYHLGKTEEAIHWAREAKNEFYTSIADHLTEHANEGKRVRLNVPFVRQDHRTCAPATLAMLCDFYQHPSDHDSIVAKICYDGTRASDERRWSEESGLTVREFCVTEESAHRLLDAGIPFALNTVEPGSAHLQAIVGYDSKRGVLLIQDPGNPLLGEALAKKLLERYAPTGPRGLAISPPEKADILREIDLPESNLYDLLHRIQRGISDHTREVAEEAITELRRIAPDHRITYWGEVAIAGYDGQPLERLIAIERLLKLFPEDEALALSKLNILGQLDRYDAQREHFEKWYAAKKGGVSTYLRLAYLMENESERPRAMYLLWRVLGWDPAHAEALSTQGSHYWRNQQRDHALELYRLAAASEWRVEDYTKSYFQAAHALGKGDEALKWLQNRYLELGNKSGDPAQTLAWAYNWLDHHQKAIDTILEATEKRPEDGSLLLSAARTLAYNGQSEPAAKLLDKAEKYCRPIDIWVARARFAEVEAQPAVALEYWQKVTQADPLDSDAHGEVARLLADTRAPDAAIEYVCDIADRFPESRAMGTLAISWLREEGYLEEAERRLDRLLDAHPIDAWAWRERAIVRLITNRLAESISDAEEALKREPSASSHTILGRIQEMAGDLSSARRNYRAALERSVDFDSALDSWMRSAVSYEDRREALDFTLDLLVKRRTNGEGLFSWYGWACGGEYPPDELLRHVDEAGATRPDLWQTWSIRSQQRTAMRRHKEAIEVAREATTRFPLTPRTWTDLADAASAGNDKETELNALRQAIRLNPNWGYAARRLADAIVHTDNRDEAQKALERALLADPRDPLVRMRLADIFDENDQKEKAIEQYRIAALYSPTNDQAWQKLIDVSADVDLGATAVAAGREITKRRPLDARAWLRLAETLNRVEDREEAYQIIERAIERNSQLVDAYDLKARYLAHDGDIEKAIEVCQAAILAGQVSPMLLWRQSTLLHDAGQTTKAIESMKQMLQIDPTIFRGWSNLCNWSQDVGQWSTFETAAAKMIELNPHSPVGFGYMSIALLRNSKRAEAIEHLEKSIEIEPSYSYAADELIRLYIEDRDFARANLILVKCARAFTVGELESARAQIAFASGDQERGIKLLEDLDAAIPGRVWLDSFHWLVQRALSDIASKISKSTMEQLLQRMSSPDCRAVYGLAWGNLASTASSIFSQHARAIEKLPDSPAWQAAVKTLVRMCNKREYREEFQKFVRILRRRIIQNESLYIEVGERLLRQPFDMDNAALKWCRPMLEQPKFPIAGLETLITAAWEAAPIRQAMQLTRQAVARPDADTTDFLPVARVIERIYSNDFLGGVEAVKMVHEERAREWHFDYYRTALLLMKLMDPACPNPREAFEQVIRAMDKFCTEGSIHQGFVDMRFKHRVLYIAHRRMKHPFKAAYHFILSHRRDRT